MPENSRDTGIEIIGRMSWGSHICQFYHSRKDLLDILIPFFKTGLKNNEFCIWITSEPLSAAEAGKALKKAVKNLDVFIRDGQIEILDYSRWYTKSGRFEAERVLAGWAEKEQDALKKGFSGLRFSGNTFWLKKKDWKNFTEYEARVNNAIGGRRMLGICTYSLNKCSASQVIDVVNNHQFTLIKRDGKWISVESSSYRTAVNELRDINSKYELFIENIPLHVAAIDKTGKFVMWNKYSEKLFNYKKKEALGKIEPKDLHVSDEDAKKVIRTAEEKGIFDGDLQLKSKNNSILDMHLVVIPYRDAHNNTVNYYGFGENITERKRAEAMLREYNVELEKRVEKRTRELKNTNEKLQTAMDNLNRAQKMAHIGSWHLDMASNTLTWSDEIYRIFGLEPWTPVDYERFLEMVYPADREYVDRCWQAALKKEPYDIEHRIMAGGKIRWVRENGQVEFDKKGNAVRGTGTVQDITEEKKQEEKTRILREELMHISRVATMGEFTAALAHEINQPILAIMSNAQAAQRFLAKENPDLKEIGEILSDIVKDDKWAGDIIARLKALLKKTESEFTKVNINNLIRDIIPIIHSEMVTKHISMDMQLDNGIPQVKGDRVQLQQVVLNLLLNGVEAVENTDLKTLRIKTHREDDKFIVVGVEDSGPGIKGTDAESLFKPFVTTKKEGLGMGLSINKAIVEAHGGSLRARNNRGSGATFYFTLPISKD